MDTCLHSVLTAVDFGEASARAVSLAGRLAGATGASLRLLHAEAIDAPAYFTHDQIEALEHQREQRRAQCDAYLARFGRQHTSTPFATVTVDGSPLEAILAESAHADLVVMGTHGRRGPSRWWLGSVAERVLRSSDRALLVTKAGTEDAAPCRRILVHAAGGLPGVAALAFARQLASCAGGEAVDGRQEALDAGLARTQATLLVVAAPSPRNGHWLSEVGEPLVRFASVPILFVPEPAAAAHA